MRRTVLSLSLLFVTFIALAFSERAAGQGMRSTILSNGPTARRINLVILSEGYTSNQLAQSEFLIHATNAVDSFFAHLPYSVGSPGTELEFAL